MGNVNSYSRRDLGQRAAVSVVSAVVAACLAWKGLAQEKPAAPLHRLRLWVVCTPSVFPTTNRSDAINAGKLWMILVARRRGFEPDCRFEILDDPAAIRKRITAGTVDVVLSDAVEYLELSRLGMIKPVVTISQRTDSAHYRYLLIAPVTGRKQSIEDLRGKSINIFAKSAPKLPHLWIESVLHDLRQGRNDPFFSLVTPVTRGSSACLPVFFARTGACVVDSINWEVMKEMNPQLGVKLEVLASSPPVLDAIASIHDLVTDSRAELIRAMVEFHLEREGRQFLTMFRTARLIPITPKDFDGVREILRTADAAPGRAGGSASAGEAGQ